MAEEEVKHCSSCGVEITSGSLCGLCQSVRSGGEIPPKKN